MKTRKASKVICYTGVNRTKTGIHTPAEFTRITRKWSKDKYICYNFKGKYVCPTNLKGWMKWSGAQMEDPAKCRKSTEAVNRNLRELDKELKVKYKADLRNIESGKRETELRALGISENSIKKMIKSDKKAMIAELKRMDAI